MAEHFRSYSAVFPVFLRDRGGAQQVLLHRRRNTGYMDGMWDLAGSGHVDAGETATQALVRECREELAVELRPEDATFAHLSHRLGERTYYDIYFLVHAWGGTPRINEPEKCDALEWFDVDALPEDMIDIRRADLMNCLNGRPYSEKRPDPPEDGYLNRVTLAGPTVHSGIIQLCAYDPAWPQLYGQVADRIRAALGSRALRVEHVGSTSVPGLCAKPVIDVVLLVDDSAAEAGYVPDLEAAGFALRIREPGWHEHRMLRGEAPAVNLHVFSDGCPEARRMIAFRDHLRADAAYRALYAEAKQALAARNWRYVQDYADAKTAAVREIMTRALKGGEQL